ncbi:MAG: hypothetical protein ACOY32_08700 [Thermodesulfobacteriota bacterium]
MDDRSGIAERRKYERLDKEMGFRYGLYENLVTARLDEQGLILDIGGGGLRFLSSRRWRKNDELLMQLDFSGWRLDGAAGDAVFTGEGCDSLLVVGSVMWVTDAVEDEQFEVGVRFTARVQRPCSVENSTERCSHKN